MGIQPAEIGTLDIILGDVWIRKFYTVYDAGRQRCAWGWGWGWVVRSIHGFGMVALSKAGCVFGYFSDLKPNLRPPPPRAEKRLGYCKLTKICLSSQNLEPSLNSLPNITAGIGPHRRRCQRWGGSAFAKLCQTLLQYLQAPLLSLSKTKPVIVVFLAVFKSSSSSIHSCHVILFQTLFFKSFNFNCEALDSRIVCAV